MKHIKLGRYYTKVLNDSVLNQCADVINEAHAVFTGINENFITDADYYTTTFSECITLKHRITLHDWDKSVYDKMVTGGSSNLAVFFEIYCPRKTMKGVPKKITYKLYMELLDCGDCDIISDYLNEIGWKSKDEDDRSVLVKEDEVTVDEFIKQYIPLVQETFDELSGYMKKLMAFINNNYMTCILEKDEFMGRLKTTVTKYFPKANIEDISDNDTILQEYEITLNPNIPRDMKEYVDLDSDYGFKINREGNMWQFDTMSFDSGCLESLIECSCFDLNSKLSIEQVLECIDLLLEQLNAMIGGIVKLFRARKALLKGK